MVLDASGRELPKHEAKALPVKVPKFVEVLTSKYIASKDPTYLFSLVTHIGVNVNPTVTPGNVEMMEAIVSKSLLNLAEGLEETANRIRKFVACPPSLGELAGPGAPPTSDLEGAAPAEGPSPT